jgi:NADP-reducing hydrogenase subunit HndA
MAEKCTEKRGREETLEICEKYTDDKDNLIAILNEVQVKYGYVPKVAQLTIAEYLHIPLAQVYGVITFYSRFTLEPKGKYDVSVCLGTACFVKGSNELLEAAKTKLGIDE